MNKFLRNLVISFFILLCGIAVYQIKTLVQADEPIVIAPQSGDVDQSISTGNTGTTLESPILSPLGGPDWNAIYSAIGNALQASGIYNNLGHVTNDNVSSFPDLQFWTTFGTLTFSGDIDLTDTNVQSFLQSAGNAFDITDGFMSFDPASGPFNIPAKLEFWPTNVYFVGVEPAKDFVVAKDADGNVLSDEQWSGLLSDSRLHCGMGEGWYCDLFVNHFTSFELFAPPAEGILPYREGNAPDGFVKIVDDITNPQYMVYIRQTAISNNGNGFTYDQMQNYQPNENEAIPSTALMNILVSSNHTTTWIAESGTMDDQGNRGDRVYDPTEGGQSQYGTNYNVMSVDGGPEGDFSTQSGPYFVSTNFYTNSNKIRTIYTTTEYVPIIPFSCDTVTDVTTGECNALVSLYDATNGDNRDIVEMLRMQDNDTTACDWYGVSCEEGHVVGIELEEISMNGAIPEEISGLSYLQTFDVYGNFITTLPESIGTLSNLTEIEFSENQISFLPDSITDLTGLEGIRGYDNLLTSLPEDIGNLVNLQTLDLYDNFMIMLPESISNLYNLEYFDVSTNQLTWIPESFTGLTSLSDLNISSNCIDIEVRNTELSDFIDSIDNVSYDNQDNCPSENVEYSDFDGGFFWDDVLFFDHLGTGVSFTTENTGASLMVKDGDSEENFVYLDIFNTTIFSNNGLRDGILRAPVYVSNPDYDTGGLPPEMSGLTTNEILNTVKLGSWTNSLSTNRSGFNVYVRIPATDTMEDGQIIHIYRSEDRYHWTPNTPDATCEPSEGGCTFWTDQTSYFTFVREFTFDCNNVTDVTPGECNALVDLYTSTDGNNWDSNDNWLDSNKVCTWYGVDCRGGSTVRWLILKDNYLSGAIPESFSNLIHLNRVNIQYNNITSIPDSIGSLSGINVLVLDHNSLTSIPESISGLMNLGQLNIQNNYIRTLPQSIGELHNLMRFFFNNNYLTTLPDTFTADNLPSLSSNYFSMYNNCIREGHLSDGVNNFLNEMEIDRGDQETNCPGLLVIHSDFGGHAYTNANSLYFYNYTSTGVTLTNEGEIMLQYGDQTHWLDFSTNGLIINVLDGTWDGLLYSPRSFTDPELGERNLPPANSTDTERQIVETIQAGASGASLGTQGGVFTIKISVDASYSGQTLYIYRSSDEGLSRAPNTPDATCVVKGVYQVQSFGDFDGYVCEFTTDHLSYFTTVKETTTDNPPTGGPGGGPTLVKDTCPDGDFSLSLYDGKCLTGSLSGSIEGSPYSTEINNAYLYSYSIGITTIPTILQADIEGVLLRSHMAKMMVNYAVKVKGLKPDTTKVCEFTDVHNATAELQEYMKLSCQLGLMGINPDGTAKTEFMPNGTVTRAEFGTVLSRVLRGDKYNDGSLYYTEHLAALKEAGIMKDITNAEWMKELRGRVMVMMMRADK